MKVEKLGKEKCLNKTIEFIDLLNPNTVFVHRIRSQPDNVALIEQTPISSFVVWSFCYCFFSRLVLLCLLENNVFIILITKFAQSKFLFLFICFVCGTQNVLMWLVWLHLSVSVLSCLNGFHKLGQCSILLECSLNIFCPFTFTNIWLKQNEIISLSLSLCYSWKQICPQSIISTDFIHFHAQASSLFWEFFKINQLKTSWTGKTQKVWS